MQVHLAADLLPSDSPAKSPLTHAIKLMARITTEGRNALRGLGSSNSTLLDLKHAFISLEKDMLPQTENGPHIEFRVMVVGKKEDVSPGHPG